MRLVVIAAGIATLCADMVGAAEAAALGAALGATTSSLPGSRLAGAGTLLALGAEATAEAALAGVEADAEAGADAASKGLAGACEAGTG